MLYTSILLYTIYRFLVLVLVYTIYRFLVLALKGGDSVYNYTVSLHKSIDAVDDRPILVVDTVEEWNSLSDEERAKYRGFIPQDEEY